MAERIELLNKTPTRIGSLCRPDIFSDLNKFLENNEVLKFEEILVQEQCKENKKQETSIHSDMLNHLLVLACKFKKPEFTKILLKYGCNPNFFDDTLQASPIHIACKQGDLDNLKLILNCPNININLKDTFGCTPLHYAVKNMSCLKDLLIFTDIDVNSVNRKGETPLHTAVKFNCEEAVTILIGENGKSLGIRLDQHKCRGKTARQVILDKYPHLEKVLPPIENKKDTNSTITVHELFTILEENQQEFIDTIVNHINMINESDGLNTFLQFSCEKGFLRVVEKLIELGADPNLTGRNITNKSNEINENFSGTLPSMIAAKFGYLNVLKVLNRNSETKFSNSNGNILHYIIEGSIATSSNNINNHLNCLQYILENIESFRLDINKGNIKGNTPLHLAARTGNKEMILLLLRHGAYIGSCNALGEPAFAKIRHDILKKSLDECIQENDELPQSDNYEIIFQYKILAPFKFYKINNPHSLELMEEGVKNHLRHHETDILLKICDSNDFVDLLKHPVISSFLNLKWDTISKFFYLNFMLYLFFWLILTTYILRIYNNFEKPSQEQNLTHNWFEENKLLMQILVVIFLVFLAIRECFQFLNNPQKYLLNPENLLEIGIIIVTIWMLTDQSQFAKQPISAVGILLSWAELVLLVGRFPMLSTYIEMLKTVTVNFLKFLCWYSILIIAFALSFYTLFHESESGDFVDPGVATFKTVIMLTGEFDVDSIPFVQHPGTSHILFVIFVFLIAIVLFNLLNGLAVSDTQQIKSQAELVGYKSRVKLISYIEIMLSNPILHKGTHKIRSIMCCFQNPICLKNYTHTSDINFCTDPSDYHTIRVLPNLGNRVEKSCEKLMEKKGVLQNRFSWFRECSFTQMRPEIVKSAKEVLENKKMEENFNMTQKIIELDGKIDMILALLEKRPK